ncbi:MAG TPA: hypothetical protein PLD59_11215 [Tepidisphaeraceae bacterium]|nr:hypothetical protein [Tepidisphaeraceae bacterium]
MIIQCPIPGRIYVAPAKFNEYKTLRRFHYRPGDPRVPCDVIAAWHQLPGCPARCVGVAVLAWPTAFHRVRYHALGIADLRAGDRMRFANANVRTIARVIVHPTFRGIGLSSRLVRALILRCPTRYIEATAMMARLHPLFDRAGMKRIERPPPTGNPRDAPNRAPTLAAGGTADSRMTPAFYLFDKWIDRLPVVGSVVSCVRAEAALAHSNTG